MNNVNFDVKRNHALKRKIPDYKETRRPKMAEGQNERKRREDLEDAVLNKYGTHNYNPIFVLKCLKKEKKHQLEALKKSELDSSSPKEQRRIANKYRKIKHTLNNECWKARKAIPEKFESEKICTQEEMLVFFEPFFKETNAFIERRG